MQVLQAQHRCAELDCQIGRQAQPDVGGLAVHHHRGGPLGSQPGRGSLAARKRIRATSGPAVGDHHHQRTPGAVLDPLADHHIAGGQQTLGQRCGAAGVEPGEPSGGGVRRGRRRQHQPGAIGPEGDHRDLVATLIGIAQQRQCRTADRGHPIPRRHRPGGVHDEDHQVALTADPFGAADVGHLGPHRTATGTAPGSTEQRSEQVQPIAPLGRGTGPHHRTGGVTCRGTAAGCPVADSWNGQRAGAERRGRGGRRPRRRRWIRLTHSAFRGITGRAFR